MMKKMNARVNTVRVLFAIILCGVLSGCGRSRIEGEIKPVETLINIGDLSYVVQKPVKKKNGNPNEIAPWHQSLRVVLNRDDIQTAKDASSKDVSERFRKAYEMGKGQAYKANRALLKELKRAVLDNQSSFASWDIMELEIGFPQIQRGGKLMVRVELGLHHLFGRRPRIIIEDTPLDVAIARLAESAGLNDAQGKGYNPKVFWRGENISVYNAAREVLSIHGYNVKFTGPVRQDILLKVEEAETREEFVRGAAEAVLTMGRSLDEAVPALIVIPRVTRRIERKAAPSSN